jgi:hypothetical protein
MPGMDALKALSRLHQQQYVNPAPPTEWDDYLDEAQGIASPEMDTGLDAATAVNESPVMMGLRRMRGGL